MRRQTLYAEGSMDSNAQYQHDLGVFEAENGLKIVDKSESFFMKALYVVSFMWIWNRGFMTDYVTTIGSTMYATKDADGFKSIGDLALLRHEYQHVADSKHYGQLAWAFLYLFPQSLAAFAILAFWHWGFVFALAFLGPWPAPFRCWVEMRGYARTFWTWEEFGRPYSPVAIDESTRRNFCGWGYYRMSWSWKRTKVKMDRVLASRESG